MNYMWDIQHVYNNNLFKERRKDLGLSKEEFKKFIDHAGNIRSPYELKNMDLIVNRIQDAILNNEKIMIAGDYDVDGTTACSIMMLGLLTLTKNVYYDIPDRMIDGYGLSERLINRCKEEKINLLITVDCGIAEHELVKKAIDEGIDVIVTDHHPWNTDTLPCELTIDPYIDENYPFKGICGAMVAYKVIRALLPDIKKMDKDLNNQMIVLAAIATIADVMPVRDENRIFVYHGLKLANITDNYGLNALLKELNINKPLTEKDVGYSIAPCVNAAGRIENATQIVDLFLSDDEIEAEKIAKHIVALNEKRKAIQQKVIENIEVDDSPVIIQEIKDVPAGIMGIIANRIADTYMRPCFAVTKNNGRYGGSGRSVYGYNLSQNIFLNNDLDISGGGHSEACAMNIAENDFDEFKKRCNENYLKFLEENEAKEKPMLNIDFLINFKDITFSLLYDINRFRPFGQGNDEIVFCAKNVEILDKKILGKKQNALKFSLAQNEYVFDAICFNAMKDFFISEFDDCRFIDLAFTIELNEFMGRRSIQLMPKDFKKGS